MKIQKAKKEDLKEIAKILKEESVKKPYDEKYTLNIAFKEVKELFEEELYVAVEDKKIVGFIASCITSKLDKRAYINELWVLSKYQKKGIGKSLINFIESFYKKKGIRKIRLTTRKDANAYEFYKKVKYNEYKKLVYMEKKL